MFDTLFDALLGEVDFTASTLVNEAIERTKVSNLTKQVSLEEQPRGDISKSLVPVKLIDPLTVAENRFSLCNNRRRKSAFIRGNASDHGSLGSEGMDPLVASVKRLVRVHLQPFGFNQSPIIGELFYTLLPDQTRIKLGVLRLSKKRIIFSSVEWQHLRPDLRLSLLYVLNEWGLIPNDCIRDANLPFKGKTKFCHPDMQSFLRLSIDPGRDPTMPYTVTDDHRPSKPCEIDPVMTTRTRDIHKFVAVGKQHSRELQHIRSRALSAENALIRANRDIQRLEAAREALLTLTVTQKPTKTKTGKVIDLTGRIK